MSYTYANLPIEQVRPNAKNTRTHSKKQIRQIATSIRELGFAAPVLVDEYDVLIAGHGRLEAARSLGMASIPAIVLDGLSDAKKRALMLADNRIRRQWPATAIDSKLTAMGKDERALSVSGYVYRGSVKYTAYAFDKTTVHKRKSRNHLVDQIESFRIGGKDNKREDDLLDTFCYGIAIGLGNNEGF
jgi:hypothetical protein